MAETATPPATSTPAPPATSTPPATPAAPEATPAPKAPVEATTDDETVTIKKSDYKNLLSGRDKAKTEAAANQDFVLELAKEREIDSFLETNKDKFSYLKREDLMHLEDPTLLQAESERLQRRFEDIIQDALLNVGQAKPAPLSEADKAKELKSLKKNKPDDAFERMVDLQRA